MARKTKQLELDDFGFADLDIPDFDFPSEPPKDDRSAVTKAGTGFLKGAKESAVSEAAVRKLIKDGLPKGYGTTVDTVDQGARTLRNLYNSTAREVRPAINEGKQTIERILPSFKGFLPKKAYDRAEKWAGSYKKSGSQSLSQAEMREAELQSMLGEVFKGNMEQDAKREAKREVRERMTDQTALDRHTDSITQLNSIRLATQQMSEYQSKVDASFQRRLLEVSYRQFYLLGDMHIEQKRQGAFLETNLAGIMKNTGLPEFAKLKGAERLQEVIRNKFMDGMTGGFFSKRQNFMSNVGERISRGIRDKVSDSIGQLRQGMAMAETMAEMQQMQREMGMAPSGWETAGSFAGGAVADSLMGRAGKRLGRWTRANPKIMRLGNRLQHGAENLPQNAREWSRNYISDGSLWGNTKQFLADSVNGAMAQDNSYQKDSLGGMNEPDIWRRQSSKTLNEIIPGYLSRILRELQITRTGDTSIGLTTYDFNANKFDSESAARKRAFGNIVKDSDKRQMRDDINALVDKIDPKKTLTPEQRKALGQQLLRDNMNDRGDNARRLTDPNSYSGAAAKHSSRYADLFADYLTEDDLYEKRLGLGRDISGLGRWMSDTRAEIQHMVNVGDYEGLRDMGLIDESGQINMEKLYNYYGGDEYNPAEGSTAAANGPRRPRRRSRSGAKVMSLKANRQRPADRLTMPVMDFQRQGIQTDENCTCAEKIVKAIQEDSAAKGMTTVNDTLLRIEQQLAEGISMNLSGMGGEDEGGIGWNRTVGQNLRGLWNKGSRWGKSARDLVMKRGRQGLTQMNRARKWGWDKAQDLFGKGKEKWEEFRNVYVKGRIEPALEAWKLKAGKYFDKDGKVIQKWKDIKGAVFDENGELVMSADDLKDAFVRSKVGEKLISAFGAVKSTVMAGVDSVRNFVPQAWQTTYDMGKKLFDRVTDAPQDVYVKGKPDPVLLAVKMKAGAYASKATGKVVDRPSKIDGAIYDQDTYNIVLTEDDLKAGLVDRFGKPLRTGFGKLFQMGKDLMTNSINRLRKAGQWIGGQFGRLMGGLRTGFENIVGKDGLIFAGSRKMQTTIEEIRDLLNDRLPGKKKVFGDLSGDGVRDGSLEDQRRKRKAKQEEAAAKAKDGDQQAGPLGRMLAGLKGLFGKKKSDEESESKDGDNIVIAGGDGDGKGKKDPKGKKQGRWGRFKSRLGGLGRGAWGLAKGGLIGAGAGLAANAVGLGDYAGTIGTAAGLASMIPGVGTAIGATAGALGSATLAVGGGLLSVLGAIASSPVLLAGAAAAGAGYGLYKLWGWMSKKELDSLSKVRYAQYGFKPDQKDYVDTILSMEDKLKKAVRFGQDGKASLDDTKIDFKDLIEPFNLKAKDQRAVSNWVEWFAQRFKPVFLANVAALKGVNPSIDLGDAGSKLKPAEKLKFLSGAKQVDANIYNIFNSPFSDLKYLTADGTLVAGLFKAAEEEFGKDVKDQPGDGSKTVSADVAQNATAVAAGLVKPGDTASNSGLDQVRSLDGKPSSTQTTRGGLSVASAPAGMSLITGGRVDALTAIRFKTYGLTDMSADKIRALEMLEELISKDLSFSNKTGCKWSGSAEAVLTAAGPTFGVSGTQNIDAYRFVSWFNFRFLPTFVNFMSAGYRATGKTSVLEIMAGLRPEAAVDVAMTTYTTQSNYNGTVSVWSIQESPWPNYTVNQDVKSIDVNLQGLKERAKNTVLDEETAKNSNNSAQRAQQDAQARGEAATSFWDKIFGGNKAKDPENNKPGFASTEGGAAFGVYGGRGRARGSATLDNTGMPNQAGGGDLGGGMPVEHPGGGSGGDVNQIPMPTGDGSWGALKGVITAAAKMAGVDPKLMASIAAIESGFRATVKAGTSSATGLYQFIKSTWNAMIQKYGAKYGINPNTSPTDPRANALMGAEYLKENANAIKSVLKGRAITDTDLYMAHFLGAGGARKFLSADPNAIAANVMPEAARANASIFYDGRRPRTVAEVYALMNQKLRTRGKKFGIEFGSDADGSEAVASPGTAAAQANSANQSAAAQAVADASGEVAPQQDVPTPTPKTSNNPTGGAVPVTDMPMGPTPAPIPSSSSIESSKDQLPEFTKDIAYKTVGHTADGSEIFYDVTGAKQVRSAGLVGPHDPNAAVRIREQQEREIAEDYKRDQARALAAGTLPGDDPNDSAATTIRKRQERARQQRLLAEAAAQEANGSNMSPTPPAAQTDTIPTPTNTDYRPTTQDMSQRSMDMNAMAKAQSETMTSNFSGVTSLLREGVSLQTQMVTLLTKVVGRLDEMAEAKSSNPPAAQTSPLGNGKHRNAQGAAPTAPVSMAKASF